ncbi:MAG: hypothetical protein JXR68_10610 [Bacteroidales bacterium]|nr:hypothetical protein [Bacteroidales bacterium]
MKKIKYFLLILLFGLIACKKNNTEFFVTGVVSDFNLDIDEKLYDFRTEIVISFYENPASPTINYMNQKTEDIFECLKQIDSLYKNSVDNIKLKEFLKLADIHLNLLSELIIYYNLNIDLGTYKNNALLRKEKINVNELQTLILDLKIATYNTLKPIVEESSDDNKWTDLTQTISLNKTKFKVNETLEAEIIVSASLNKPLIAFIDNKKYEGTGSILYTKILTTPGKQIISGELLLLLNFKKDTLTLNFNKQINVQQ